MKTFPFSLLSSLALVAGLTVSGCAAEPPAPDRPLVPVSPVTPPVAVAPDQPATGEVTLTGLIQPRLAIGGETSGWVLEYDQNKRIELLLPINELMSMHLYVGMPVALTGSYVTRTYPERGEVRFLAVRRLVQIQTSAEPPRGR